MRNLDLLLKYIPLIEGDEIGEWVFVEVNDGSKEKPFRMPYVKYSEVVDNFLEDFYEFQNINEDIDLFHYHKILEENNIEWNKVSMVNADVSMVNAECILALITGAIRAERFSDGALLRFFKEGLILKWLERLSEC